VSNIVELRLYTMCIRPIMLPDNILYMTIVRLSLEVQGNLRTGNWWERKEKCISVALDLL